MNTEPIIDLDLGPDNGTLKFFSLEEMQQFEDAERRFWGWLSASPVAGNLQQPWNVINTKLTQIRTHLSQASVDDSNRIQRVRDSFEQAFRSSRIPLSTSSVGTFIDQLKGEAPLTAAAALTTWMNAGGVNLAQFEHAKGVVLMAAFDAQITRKTPSAVKHSLEKLHREFREASAKTAKETLEQRAQFSRDKSAQRRAVAGMLRQSRRRLNAFREKKRIQADELASELNKRATDTISSLKQTDSLYREHMRLQGPVEYWNSKAQTHKKMERKYQRVLIRYSSIAGAVLLIALYFIANRAIQVATADKPTAAYLILVTMGIVLTTIAFWIARILTRLFLSEHHLAIDAEERSVMAQTYLALTAEGQATEQERSIVLGSLFRPTADGIVKDDAAPDFSTASLLSKITTRP